MGIGVIETPRLCLRKMALEDVEGLLEVFADPKVAALFGCPPFTHDRMTGWVKWHLAHQEEYGYGLFSVILKSDGRLVGDCGLEHMELDGESVVELGYDLCSAYWGMGLATEAAQAVLDYAFNELGLPEVVSLIQTHNAASRRVAEKLGMRLRRTFSHDGRSYALYAIAGGRGQQENGEGRS